jgi:arylsulfatase A-like enzyme
MKNQSVIILVACLGIFALLSCSSRHKVKDNRPNIILICADDMGWSDLGCYGSEIQTPNLDRLAGEGMRFTSFYNTSKCFPSRACLLTGVYAQQCGYHLSYKNPIRNAVTLGEVLRDAGYRTLFSGKHHGLENPYYRGFDRYYGLKEGACNHFNPGLQREGEPVPANKGRPRPWCFDSLMLTPYTPEEKDFYTTDYFTKYAIGWL